ncbi:MAG: peptide ABC transporter substrate-binding protein [Chloroflexi bacterium]|nr:MAG: peptide ABC transporter substrate-binding protein [Chloroflexota bacterium]
MEKPGYWRSGLAIAVTAAIAFTACTPNPASPSTGPSASAAAKRGAGETLNILYWQAPTILNAHQATGTKDADAARLVLEPLASWDKNGKAIANALASEVPTVDNGGVAKDFTSVTWKLRTGVKWSDGSPFSADDVVGTYTYQCDETTAASTFDVCEGVVNAFKPGDNVQYDLNENFRDPNKPFFKHVNFKGGGDAASAARAVFQTGDVDYGWNLQVEAAVLKPMAQGSSVGNLVTVYGSSIERLVVNFSNPDASLGDNRGEPSTKHPFFTDIHVRRALAMATNRQAVATQLYGDGLSGKATCNILTAPEPMNSQNTTSLDVCKFDVAAANKELDDDGWVKGSDGVRAKGGVKLKILYQTTVNSVRQSTQAILKKDWESVGFSVELKSVPSSTFFTNTSPDGANHFWADIEMYTNSGDPDPTSYYASGWSTGQIASKANNWNFGNYGRYSNKDFDSIVDQLRKETDASKRNQLAIQANDLLIKDVAVIPLINRTFATSGIAKSLKGVDPSPWDSEMYNIADWSK